MHHSQKKLPTAILYQAHAAPAVDGIVKPMKEGGYRDSGADIAIGLKAKDWPVVTPVEDAEESQDDHWVFPDTKKGIDAAIGKGACCFWLNTVLYEDHVITSYFGNGYRFIGQRPLMVETYDDKLVTNARLKALGLPILDHARINSLPVQINLQPPLVVKPIRGRGSQGVRLVEDAQELNSHIAYLLDQGTFGKSVYVEPFLSGVEITLTVMPAGQYLIDGQQRVFNQHWCLPVVVRENHHHGIAPYSGKVAVTKNSRLLNEGDDSSGLQFIVECCAQAGGLLNAKAPLRIDCRANGKGDYFIFDVNLKPNMTGSIRSHRKDQDGLCALAASGVGWSYAEMIENIAMQAWEA